MSNDIIKFDINQIKNWLNNNQNQKILKFRDKNSKFFILPESSKYKNKEQYLADISNNNYHYIGILTEKLKKELFGYILFAQKDEYLGQISNEAKNGFGIYKFNNLKEGTDIYIGDFVRNQIKGRGIYIHTSQSLSYTPKPVEYICSIGNFENGQFKNGIIYTFDENFQKLEFKKDEKEGLDKEENEVFSIERKGNIYAINKGIMKDNKLIEGIIISIKDNKDIENKFYFKLKEDSDYEFNYLDDEDREKELIEEFNKSNFINFKKEIIVDAIKKINEIILEMKNDFIKTIEIEDKFKEYFSELLNYL